MQRVSMIVYATIACGAVLAGGAPVYAAAGNNNTAQAELQLTIKDGCFLRFDNDQNTFSFAPFVFLPRPIEQQGSFSIICNAASFGNKDITVSLDGGSANPADRPMNSALYKDGDLQQRLLFQVYKETSGESNVWGDNSDGATPYTVSLDASGAAKNKPFIVQLPQQSLDNLTEGTYANVLTVTVNFESAGGE